MAITCPCQRCTGAPMASGTSPGYYSCGYAGSNYQSGSSCYNVTTQNATYNPPFVSYAPRLRLSKSVAGTVSTVNTINVSAEIRSIKVVTNNDTINVYGYSGTGSTSQIGYFNHNASGATKANYVGIIKTDVASLQGNTLDNFLAE